MFVGTNFSNYLQVEENACWSLLGIIDFINFNFKKKVDKSLKWIPAKSWLA